MARLFSAGKIDEASLKTAHAQRQGSKIRSSHNNQSPAQKLSPNLVPSTLQLVRCLSDTLSQFLGFADICAVRSSLSQLNGLPSIARFTVLNSTIENTCR